MKVTDFEITIAARMDGERLYVSVGDASGFRSVKKFATAFEQVADLALRQFFQAMQDRREQEELSDAEQDED